MNRKRKPRLSDLMWAVGLFEGEGCISTQLTYHGKPSKAYAYPRLEIHMTDEDTLRRFQDIMGGHLNGPYRGKNRRKLAWRWLSQAREDTKQIILWFYPHFCSRRQQCARKVFGKELFK